MSGQRKLSDSSIQLARDVTKARREALRLARMYPTVAQIAAQLGCTPRYLQKVLAGKVR